MPAYQATDKRRYLHAGGSKSSTRESCVMIFKIVLVNGRQARGFIAMVTNASKNEVDFLTDQQPWNFKVCATTWLLWLAVNNIYSPYCNRLKW